MKKNTLTARNYCATFNLQPPVDSRGDLRHPPPPINDPSQLRRIVPDLSDRFTGRPAPHTKSVEPYAKAFPGSAETANSELITRSIITQAV